MTPHVPYMNHYSRGVFQEQALLSIWSVSWSKWLKIRNKRKRSPNELLDSADCRDRTCDLRVTSALLYQLS